MDYKIYWKMIFGSYGQARHEANPTYKTMPRTLGAIYLWTLYTQHGGFEVINLFTGKITYSRKGYSN